MADDRQAESAAGGLSRKIWIEDLRRELFGDAFAAISDGHFDVETRREEFGLLPEFDILRRDRNGAVRSP